MKNIVPIPPISGKVWTIKLTEIDNSHIRISNEENPTGVLFQLNNSHPRILQSIQDKKRGWMKHWGTLPTNIPHVYLDEGMFTILGVYHNGNYYSKVEG